MLYNSGMKGHCTIVSNCGHRRKREHDRGLRNSLRENCSVKELVFSIRFGHTFNRHRHEPEIDTPSESLPAVQDEYYVQYIRIDNTMSELFEKLFNPSAAWDHICMAAMWGICRAQRGFDRYRVTSKSTPNTTMHYQWCGFWLTRHHLVRRHTLLHHLGGPLHTRHPHHHTHLKTKGVRHNMKGVLHFSILNVAQRYEISSYISHKMVKEETRFWGARVIRWNI